MLRDFAHSVVYSVLGMASGNRLSDVLEFFIYDVIKIFLLLSAIIFAVSVIRAVFVGIMAVTIIGVGYLFNSIL